MIEEKQDKTTMYELTLQFDIRESDIIPTLTHDIIFSFLKCSLYDMMQTLTTISQFKMSEQLEEGGIGRVTALERFIDKSEELHDILSVQPIGIGGNVISLMDKLDNMHT